MNNSFARMITLLARKSQAYLSGALAPYGLKAGEHSFFMAVQHNEGLTQEELSTLVCVDKAATARTVRSLEEKGYLTRVQDEADRRQNRIHPTGSAKALCPAIEAELFRFNALLTQGIDQESLDIAYRVLEQMEENAAALTGGKKAPVSSREEGRHG